MVPPVNYKCKCNHWCGSRLYIPKDDDIVFKCDLCTRVFLVSGKYFDNILNEELDLAAWGSEYLSEWSEENL